MLKSSIISVEEGVGAREVPNIYETKEDISNNHYNTRSSSEEMNLIPKKTPDEVADVSIIVRKSEHVLELYDGEECIATYPVGLSKEPVGTKTREGDNKVPEGDYYVCVKNAKSKFHLSLGLSYPNISDATNGYENGLISESELQSITDAINAEKQPDWYTALGGEIMIHGGDKGASSDWTRGCIAVDNDVIDTLWEYCNVGTKVTVLP